MVNRCKAVGVGIYVDAVINHMAALGRNFPEVPYGTNDFHSCTTTINYSNAWSIQHCDLLGLNDLKTEADCARAKLANYLNDLTSLGVAGFRLNAAKHMPPVDISNIVGRLAGTPYISQEVIRGAGEPVQTEQYTQNGLGNWTVASAVKLSPTSYPAWTGIIQLSANSSIQWKCLMREETNPANGVVWQGGSNNLVNTAGGTSVSASF